MGVKAGFAAAVSDLYPGLVEKARDIIEASEKEYDGKEPGREGGFLWEHTVHVASLAYDLAVSEGLDPVLPVLAALFHDAGKFRGGKYHEGDRPEEEDSAALAVSALEDAGARASDIAKVRNALRALYDEKVRRNALADVVHDADFLSKFGYLGVANFFVKSTLRGRNLESAAMDYLSKELTYAAVLPANMRTATARRLAVKKSADTLRFYRAYLGELKEAHGMDFRIRAVEVPSSVARARKAKVSLVLPVACGSCGGKWETEFRTEKGLKCEKLETSLRCAACGERRAISFCLPEVG